MSMNTNCLFCKIIKGEIPSEKVYEDDVCFVIHDIKPQAPVHLLVIAKKHIESLMETELTDLTLDYNKLFNENIKIPTRDEFIPNYEI